MRILTKSALPLVASMLIAAPAASQTYGLGSTPPGSIAYASAAAISKVAKEKAGLRLLLQPNAGTSAVFALVNAGEMEFGIHDVTEMGEAVAGTGKYVGRARTNLRVLAIMYPINVGYFVRADSAIKTIADLKGKRFPTGWGTFSNGPPISKAILATAGLSEADTVSVPVSGLIKAVDDFIAGKVAAAMFGIGGPKVAQANAAVGGVRFLSIDDSPAAVAAIHSVRPGFYFRKFDPAPHFAGIVGPTNLMAFDQALYANTSVADEVIYKLAKALHANKPALAKMFPFLNQFRPDEMAKDIPLVEYHPGAIKFYREIGQWPPPKRS